MDAFGTLNKALNKIIGKHNYVSYYDIINDIINDMVRCGSTTITTDIIDNCITNIKLMN